MLYIAIGILGATVMPHNLYLHSSIVQTRDYPRTPAGKREAIRFANIDSAIALMLALFVNAAILVLAAAVFHRNGHFEVAEIGDAYKLLTPMLGFAGASTMFALALLASGQNSTITGTLAGQIVMEGFLSLRLKPWLRRLITRCVAIVPTIFVTLFYGERGTARPAHPQRRSSSACSSASPSSRSCSSPATAPKWASSPTPAPSSTSATPSPASSPHSTPGSSSRPSTGASLPHLRWLRGNGFPTCVCNSSS